MVSPDVARAERLPTAFILRACAVEAYPPGPYRFDAAFMAKVPARQRVKGTGKVKRHQPFAFSIPKQTTGLCPADSGFARILSRPPHEHRFTILLGTLSDPFRPFYRTRTASSQRLGNRLRSFIGIYERSNNHGYRYERSYHAHDACRYGPLCACRPYRADSARRCLDRQGPLGSR